MPYQRIVSKPTWTKLTKSAKRRYFYYGERIQLKRGKHRVTATVQDCGGFNGCGYYRKNQWIPRLFDCTPAVFGALKFSGTATVKWRVLK